MGAVAVFEFKPKLVRAWLKSFQFFIKKVFLSSSGFKVSFLRFYFRS